MQLILASAEQTVPAVILCSPPFSSPYYLKFYRLVKIIFVWGLKISHEPPHFPFPAPQTLVESGRGNAASGKPSGSLEIHVSISLPRNHWKLVKFIWQNPEDYQTQSIWLHVLQIQSFIHGSLCSSYTNPTQGNYKELWNKYVGESGVEMGYYLSTTA